jgi:hypothetical protein
MTVLNAAVEGVQKRARLGRPGRLQHREGIKDVVVTPAGEQAQSLSDCTVNKILYVQLGVSTTRYFWGWSANPCKNSTTTSLGAAVLRLEL